MDWFVKMLAKFLAVTLVLTLHEFAHAFVAYKCGDPTAKWAGRMTLNPAKHFDPLGLVCFVFAGFGWAKPVPINEANFKKYGSGCFWTSAAGVIVNYLSAFIFYPLMVLAVRFMGSAEQLTYGHEFLFLFTNYLFAFSLSFCVFNLLPFYPLDGGRVLKCALATRRILPFFTQIRLLYFNRSDCRKLSLRNACKAHGAVDFHRAGRSRLYNGFRYGNFRKTRNGAVGTDIALIALRKRLKTALLLYKYIV